MPNLSSLATFIREMRANELLSELESIGVTGNEPAPPVIPPVPESKEDSEALAQFCEDIIGKLDELRGAVVAMLEATKKDDEEEDDDHGKEPSDDADTGDAETGDEDAGSEAS